MFKRKDATHPINMNFSNNQRKQPGHESAPKPEPDAESGYSTTTTLSDRLKDFNDESTTDQSSAVRRSPQGSDCSSSGYSNASFGSNRSKNIGRDFNSQRPFKPESFRKIHEELLQSRQEDLRKREYLLRQLEDSLSQWEDILRQQAVQQEAQRKIDAVGDEQHLKSEMTHSCGSERSSCKEKERETEDSKRILKEKDEQLKMIRFKLKEQRKETETLQQRLNYEEEQHQNTRSALKEKDMEIKYLQERFEDMKNKLKHHHLRSSMKENEKEKESEDLKRIIKEKDEQLKLIRIQEKEAAQQEQHQLRSLKDKEKESEALKRIINEKDEQLQLMKSASKEKQKEAEALLQRVHEMEEQLKKSRSALTKKEDEDEKLNQRKLEGVEYKEQGKPRGNSDEEFSDIIVCFQRTRKALEEGNKTLESLLESTDDITEYHQEFSKELSSAIKDRKKALKNLQEMCMKDPKLIPRLNEFMTAERRYEYRRYTMTQFVQHKQKLISSVGDYVEKELTSLLKRMKEVDEELERTRSAVHEKDEELKSFKDRVAGDVASSIRTGKAINLNNPVSKPRIIELYEDLRQKWPKIKSYLKSKEEKLNSSTVRNLMEKVFNEAKAEMKQKMKQIDDVFELNTPKSDATNSKVKEYRQLTIQNLQLAIYSEKQQDLKNPTPLHQFEPHDDVVDYLRHECFWLGRLMALNDPPLEPDWRSPLTTYDKWDILPHNITECQKDQQKIESSQC